MDSANLARPEGPAASALVHEHGRAMRAFIGARVRDASLADDLCQETFAAALDRGVPATDAGGVGRWLFAIARNKVLKHMRDDRHTGLAVAERPAPADDGPGRRAEADEERGRVRAAVHALDEELRETVLLCDEGSARSSRRSPPGWRSRPT